MKSKSIENRIKRAMFEKGINQSDLARKLGITRGVVSNWFTSNRNLSLPNMEKIAKALGVPVSFLMEDVGQKNFVENSGTIGNIGDGQGKVSLSARQDLLDEKIKRFELEFELIKNRLEKLENKK